MTNESITLYYRKDGSDKVYKASLEACNGGSGYVVLFAYGRRGSTLQTWTKTTSPQPYEAAKKIYDRLIQEKTGKGYTPGEYGTPYKHTHLEQRDSGIRCQLLNPIE